MVISNSVGIIGAGPIGSLLANYFLQFKLARSVTLYEGRPEGQFGGLGIHLPPDIIEALDNVYTGSGQRLSFTRPCEERIRYEQGTPQRKQFQIPFFGVEREDLVLYLRDQADKRKATIKYDQKIQSADIESLGHDLVIGADGFDSVVVKAMGVESDVEVGGNYTMWLPVSGSQSELVFSTQALEDGLADLILYETATDRSTAIFDINPQTYTRLGLDKKIDAAGNISEEGIRVLQDLFGQELGERNIEPYPMSWRNMLTGFVEENYKDGKLAVGDAHLSIFFAAAGSTQAGISDIVTLINCLATNPTLETAMRQYQTRTLPQKRAFFDYSRKAIIDRTKSSARYLNQGAEKYFAGLSETRMTGGVR